MRSSLVAPVVAGLVYGALFQTAGLTRGSEFELVETDDKITIETSLLSAIVAKRGYVSGVAGGTFLDKSTGFHDAGFGLDIVDWIMEPGSDLEYRDQLPSEMVYRYGDATHGKIAKRSIEGPQICTQAKELAPRLIHGDDFVAVTMTYRYRTAAPGRKTGSLWTQTLVFPKGKRYFVSSDRIDSVNESEAMFLRVDMPGHIRHNQQDTFDEVFLSYHGKIPATEFEADFAPDEKFLYRRNDAQPVDRMIRGYRLKSPKEKKLGPWLAGMTLEPSLVSEAWCHQRGYVCMIEEFGGRPIKAGESFAAAFIVGFFDSIDEMERVYDEHRGKTGLEVDADGWRLIP